MHELEHGFPIADPVATFRSIPSWSAPLRPLFEQVAPDRLQEAEAAFTRLVAERSGADGLVMRALVAIGTRESGIPHGGTRLRPYRRRP